MKIVVVGAGPAGIRAVERLVEAGLAPIWIDEAADGGGRIYQRPPAPMARDATTLYGFEAGKARRIHKSFDRLKGKVDWRPGTLVWHIRPAAREVHARGPKGSETIPYDAAILCTGAMDRLLPVKGWTLPGVTSLGAAQIALKAQGCLIGRRVALVGSGPLLWLIAYQYAKAGATLAAVLDTTPFATKLAAAPGLMRDVATFAKGLWYTAWLRLNRQRVHEGVLPVEILGDAGGVTGLLWRDAQGRTHRETCDAVALGWGLKPEAQLADLAGVPFRHDEIQANWVPERDLLGRTSVPGIYLAGDGAGIGGADMAELAGRAAARAALEDGGIAPPGAEARDLAKRLSGKAKFRVALEKAFPFPAHLASALPDETLICRCEEITMGDLRAAALRDEGQGSTADLNRAKAFSRVGMGRCQGRICGHAAAAILAAGSASSIATVGRLRGQPPVKPLVLTPPQAEPGVRA